MGVIGALRRSSKPSAVLLFASWLRRHKDISINFVPLRFNPADLPTRDGSADFWLSEALRVLSTTLNNYPLKIFWRFIFLLVP